MEQGWLHEARTVPRPARRRSAAGSWWRRLSARLGFPADAPAPYNRRVLTELTIEGFKAIKSATLELGAFTLLIGRNGSGKSSVLEALEWLREAARLGLEEATLARYRGFEGVLNRRCSQLGLELWFETGTQKPVHYELEVRRGAQPLYRPIVQSERCTVGRTMAARVEISSRRPSSGNRRGAPFRWIRGEKGGRPWVINSGDVLALGEVEGKTRNAQELSDFLARAVFLRLSPTAMAGEARGKGGGKAALSEDGSDLPFLVERLGAKAREALLHRVKGIFPSVESIEVGEGSDGKHIVIEEKMISRGGHKVHPIPAWLLSEGMRRIVAIFALLESAPRPPLLAIEEVENGLDPWTLAMVLAELRRAASMGTQIILTTHSPFFLDHLDLEDVIHVRRERGESRYERVSELSSVAKYKDVLAPGAMYLQKLFGDRGNKTDAAGD